MPVNRNALVRYRTLDNCLRNRYRKWTLEDLMEQCSAVLYEYEGIDKGVSRRTIQMDLQMMRSDKLGYFAPIEVVDKKYYTYTDPHYSITNIPLTNQDLNKLTEVVDILRQFKGFSHFQDLSSMVQRLEDKIYTSKTKQETLIDFEKNDNLKGLEHLDTLYHAVQQKKALLLSYQSFRAKEASNFVFHPYYLKEYRNRWFVLGCKSKAAPLLTLALDRIASLETTDSAFSPCMDLDLPSFFKHVIGVTVNANQQPENIVLFLDRQAAPYVLTKPMHHSQQLVETRSDGVIISLLVQHNYELEREILGFGDKIKVIGPERLKRRMKEALGDALDLYNYDMYNANLRNQLRKLDRSGFTILAHVFTKKEMNHIKAMIAKYQSRESTEENKTVYAVRDLIRAIPGLKYVLFNHNLKTILKAINPALFLSKAIYFDKPPLSNWYVTWHQDITINVQEKIETEGFSAWTQKEGMVGVRPPEEILKQTFTLRIHLDDTDEKNGALKVIPGSQNKVLSHEEIASISQNTLPFSCDVACGGIHLMKPLLLHSSSKTTNQKHRRVLHLEFTAEDLPNGLAWAEKMEL